MKPEVLVAHDRHRDSGSKHAWCWFWRPAKAVAAALALAAIGIGAGVARAQSPDKPDGNASLNIVPGVMILDLNTYNGIGMPGDTKNPDEQALNFLKNRWSAPGSFDWDKKVSMASLLAAGKTVNAFSERKAGVIEGTCVNITAGSLESSNGHKRGENERDTILELGPDPWNPLAKTVRAVVSPRWRHIMKQLGQDWTTHGLKERLMGQRVRVSGWLLLDGEKGWVVHPATRIENVVK